MGSLMIFTPYEYYMAIVIRWAGHVARMAEKRNTWKVWRGNVKERNAWKI
jgi:hypothetical protein